MILSDSGAIEFIYILSFAIQKKREHTSVSTAIQKKALQLTNAPDANCARLAYVYP